jgi:hypothetical protein
LEIPAAAPAKRGGFVFELRLIAESNTFVDATGHSDDVTAI